MDRSALELQVREAHGKLAREAYYSEAGGMAVFVTEDGVVWTAVQSNRYPKMMLRIGHGLAGVYTSASSVDWVLDDVFHVAEALGALGATESASKASDGHGLPTTRQQGGSLARACEAQPQGLNQVAPVGVM